ncbi:MAG: MetQ/NlpA family ABC transporter substrate-binding protein [Bacillaceae bacterium]|nr:MetQ/NlpA family ABC transporter substrate-binding protein [Bacillaceae bacterium]
MKKLISFALVALLAVVLTACGGGDKGIQDGKLVVGASNVPHAEILEQIKPVLQEQGIELEIKVFQDYVLPNQTLRDKELDANYFQHIPYLTAQNAEHDYNFVNVGGIHIEPIGVYSTKHTKLEDLPEGAEILVSSAVPDHGRVLSLLQEKGLITLAEGVERTRATIDDIVDNPKGLKFNTNFEAAFLPTAYKNGEGDAILINSNYAIGAGIDPSEEAIALESPENNPYVNVIAVRKEDENNAQIKALVEALQTEEVQNFILEKYKGSVIPAGK